MRRWWSQVIPLAMVAAVTLLSASVLPVVTASPPSPRPFDVLLKSRQFVPESGRDQLVVQAVQREPRRPVHALAQFSRDLTATDRAELTQAGVTLLGYIPDRTYFVTLDGKADLAHPTIAATRWIGAIEPADRLDARLAAPGDESEIVFDRGVPLVIVRFFADVSPAQAEATLKQAGAHVHDSIPSLNAFVAAVSRQGITMLSNEDTVQWIEPVGPPLSPADAELRQRVGADVLNGPNYNLKGNGIRILVYDSGFVDRTHVDLAGRVIWQGRDRNPQPIDHSTLVAGTIAGSGELSHGRYQGIAPQAILFSQDYRWQQSVPLFYNNPGNIEQAYRIGLSNGATLVNNSLGMNAGLNKYPCNLMGLYESTAQLLDSVVRGDWLGGQPMTLIWAAGNERYPDPRFKCRLGNGSGYRTIAPPASAKNPILVGAVNVDDGRMTEFSSWGSVADGRLKPDLVAPGDSYRNGLWSTSVNNDYTSYRGTSAAAPVVTGLTALMLERYRQLYPGHTPLPATLKALLINTARDQNMDWGDPARPGPDYAYGYGEVDGKAAVIAVQDGQFIEVCLEAGQGSNVFTVRVMQVNEGSQKLQVSLAWDDVAAVPNSAGPNLVNDLDLVLIDPSGTPHKPWVLDPAQPEQPAQRGANHLDNVEQVTVNNPASGTWVIRVDPFRIPQGPQRYALAVAGGTLMPEQRSPLHVSSMAMRSRKSAGRYQVSTFVTVVNAAGAPVPGAVVEIRTVGPEGPFPIAFATTDSNGNATVRLVSKKAGMYYSAVREIVHATLDRDRNADVRTTAWIVVSR